LCVSGIPGAGYGVCAKQTIPLGTWIGPYEGELVRPEDVFPGTDTSYMWEVNYCYFDCFHSFTVQQKKNLLISYISPKLSNRRSKVSLIRFVN